MMLTEGGIHFAALSLAQNAHFPFEFDHGGLDTKPMLLYVRCELFRQRTSSEFVYAAALSAYRKCHWTIVVLMIAATYVRVDRFQAMDIP